ncbi:GNAT family N-acetyltransferase [Micromonospora parathelypteridis]|uniref:GNAT superfamily N-acetyltransferase n=1 Tax=Micromonospora parathelypteridis TaxID=1839617 RepID=A0A840VYY5_9ACTN|nr:GNAT family N-acetyltransferase [Micromonospora parathelypteridis]MBB5477810.1 GNAT superfamily N-acetyltransferase [Micromonospora parathelypteridis]GGO11800.1 N-acetyltransferase [Micromonospora parathelypteridis]
MRIRVAQPDDAPAVVALRAMVFPYLVRGVESTRKMIAEPPPGEEWTALVAEVDNQVVGWVSAERIGTTSLANVGGINLLHVHPEHRRRGVGSGLLTAATNYLRPLGVRRVRAMAQPEALPFARRHGYEPSREVRYSALDLDPAPALPEPPPGIRLCPIADLDPHLLYAADVAAAADEPGDVPVDTKDYESWQYDVWDNLGLDKTASVAAEVGGEVVAFSLVKRDGDRMWSDYTGTVPSYRGRGLARLAKMAALHRAAANGVRIAYTSNDEENAPMLAINARLGYRPVAAQWSCLAELT